MNDMNEVNFGKNAIFANNSISLGYWRTWRTSSEA